MSKNTSGLELVKEPQAYFLELITGAARNQKIALSPETEIYLVNLLKSYMIAERLYVTNGDGQRDQKTLASQIQEAFEEATREAQRLMFRQLGDSSLYVAGFFRESLNKKLVDVGYYIDMGGIAYSQVASMEIDRHMKQVYTELADRFASFVEVLAEVSESTNPTKNEKDLLMLYDTWRATRSPRAEKALKKAGIQPVASPFKRGN